MEDRFKFRAYHKPTKQMFDVYGFNEDCVFADTLDGIGTALNPALIEDCILMQCTGIKDKNGNLIYEGDIVSLTYFRNPSHLIGYVAWNKDDASFIAVISSDEDHHIYGNAVEVIGNIHETPEILENN